MGKRGALLDKEIVEIVLGAAGIVLLAFLFYNLIAPNFDKSDETAKSYFDNFLEKLPAGTVEITFHPERDEEYEIIKKYF